MLLITSNVWSSDTTILHVVVIYGIVERTNGGVSVGFKSPNWVSDLQKEFAHESQEGASEAANASKLQSANQAKEKMSWGRHG